ncbi:MAG: 16S rRNA (adenine(1518)-N(6)/adenine(1519)-N(6))-dimethyltransferase, partial [Bacteroidales bacterium]|nr:16S rRNA (adenine(1518)-N(6)/adenine(1519)-N(6))-dimethyltransferase [Bacteroidales bacterium]
MNVRPKKYLGQHFLTDLSVAQRIVDSLGSTARNVLEIGPGMGVLTQFLLQRDDICLNVVEIDEESVDYLREHYPQLASHLYSADFLQMDLARIYGSEPFALIGNLPYNISSQIFFKVLDYRESVPEIVCMVQKEVAERIAS